MKHINLGILAHVDAGKTTLSEALLYTAGNIRKLGRVDSKDTFLDTYAVERNRGITVFSKQAELDYDDLSVTLLDTPGHVDFCAEAERVLMVLDYCILVVSGPSGVQSHTRTIWSLLDKYNIPTFVFVNKMDQAGADKDRVLEQLQDRLYDNIVDFTMIDDNTIESIAMCDEEILEAYLETGEAPSKERIAKLVADRRLCPCFFGSALKLEGIRELIEGLNEYTVNKAYPDDFGARVYKITRDEQNNRLTHLKITGGSLKAREIIADEKVNQIRIYSGEKYESVSEIEAGRICTVTGLNSTKVGMGLGIETQVSNQILEPVLTYKVISEDGCDSALLLRDLKVLEEEDPKLHVIYEERHKEILVQVMGEVLLEVIKYEMSDRFKREISFGEGSVVYKETIASAVEGVGHFEPLRHYAEVHLLLEPLDRGSGMVFDTDCSEDILDKNWQRLIMTHLEEKTHRGVLTGAPITDMKITVIAGRAHTKHTEGGDFRQATYRAVRQGLMYASSILLEPFYAYRIELPIDGVGRAMTDLEKMNGTVNPPDITGDVAVLTGTAPVACIRNYAKELATYTKGEGSIALTLDGYGPCHNSEEVVALAHYLPEADIKNTPDSVFCSHGAGVVIPWNEVYDHMHVESAYNPYSKDNVLYEEKALLHNARQKAKEGSVMDVAIGTDEVDAILDSTFYRNSSTSSKAVAEKRKGINDGKSRVVASAGAIKDPYADYKFTPAARKQKYLLVDGYNIIFAWRELNELARINIDGARDRLIDILCNYRGTIDSELIVVFDAYRVKGHDTEISDFNNIHIVFTREAETADQFIEKFASANGRKYDVTVATSDNLEQIIIRGSNCKLVSARELELLVKAEAVTIKEGFDGMKNNDRNYLGNILSEEARRTLDSISE